jgi:hypothetical protein
MEEVVSCMVSVFAQQKGKQKKKRYCPCPWRTIKKRMQEVAQQKAKAKEPKEMVPNFMVVLYDILLRKMRKAPLK